ncbi:MAG: cyclophilin-like fold protein [Cyclobacteriaceae bacterium]|nr:MAG: cyclophilin-like fold protein [Cyclobacteriaceae bacterium]
MKLIITIGDKKAEAILYDNPASRDFVSLLPLTLTLDDYAQTEKVATLPKKLSLENAPSGFKAAMGDITYYSPWGNMALFYEAFPYAPGLVSLGKITSGMENFKVKGSLKITIAKQTDNETFK